MPRPTDMLEEKLSDIPGFDRVTKPSRAVLSHEPHKRFAKSGDNAEHAHTVRMRSIKTELRLTTAQLVSELNAYEREHQAKNFHSRTDAGAPAWLPMTSVLMSSYLQGWVIQEPFMALVLKRLENLRKFKKHQPSVFSVKGDIQTVMNGWYKVLGIDPKDTSVSPTRQLGRVIAPYYKRPVRVAISGQFHLGLSHGKLRSFSITDSDGETHEFTLDPKQAVLIKDKQDVKVGDVIQYSVLMQAQKKGEETALKHEPSINHTTFFRWYSSNKMPRSIKTLELVQAAVNEAVKARLAPH
jgi:hypothetical protein